MSDNRVKNSLNSPYHIFPHEDGSVGIIFYIKRKCALELELDKDNAYKLAVALLAPYDYSPKIENFIVSQCKSQ